MLRKKHLKSEEEGNFTELIQGPSVVYALAPLSLLVACISFFLPDEQTDALFLSGF